MVEIRMCIVVITILDFKVIVSHSQRMQYVTVVDYGITQDFLHFSYQKASTVKFQLYSKIMLFDLVKAFKIVIL